jgi:adenylate kinase family enzyme
MNDVSSQMSRLDPQRCSPQPLRRIALIGSGGAGKSTFARELGAKLEIPVVHLDPIFFSPGWVEMSQVEWKALQQELVQSPAWIIDGNHAETLDVRLSAADTVILLDLNRFICMWRVIKRRISYRRKARIDRASGCEERLAWRFVRWVWTYPLRGRPQALAAIEEFAPHARVIRLSTRAQVREFLDQSRSSIVPEKGQEFGQIRNLDNSRRGSHLIARRFTSHHLSGPKTRGDGSHDVCRPGVSNEQHLISA